MRDNEKQPRSAMALGGAGLVYVSQLQAQLIQALRDKEHLQAQLAASKLISPMEKPKPYFLETIPVEIRNQIYEYLLINPNLASPETFSPPLSSRAHEQIETYNLSSGILGACRQTNEEATSVLYGKNTFIVGFIQGCAASSPVSRCKGRPVYQKDISTSPGFKNVKHWKVILSAKVEIELPSECFVKFCRALSDNTPCSLKVWIAPKRSDFDFTWAISEDKYDVAATLQPLRLLRNVKEIKLGELPVNELSIYRPAERESSPSPHDFPASFLENMKSLVEISEPVKRVWKMYEKLLKYAQAFERNDRFRVNMEPAWGAGALYAMCQTQDRFLTSKSWMGGMWNHFNPFMEYPIHPVEESLLLCSVGSESNEAEKFLSPRSNLLNYLEPQYQRIANASLQITKFVKAEKKPGCFLSQKPATESEAIRSIATWGMILLEDYAQSFSRDAPLSTRINIRSSQHKFDAAYASLERESILKQLSGILENDDFQMNTPLKFVELFKQAVDDMDTQYLEIRKARKELFDYDDENYEQVIDPES